MELQSMWFCTNGPALFDQSLSGKENLKMSYTDKVKMNLNLQTLVKSPTWADK